MERGRGRSAAGMVDRHKSSSTSPPLSSAPAFLPLSSESLGGSICYRALSRSVTQW